MLSNSWRNRHQPTLLAVFDSGVEDHFLEQKHSFPSLSPRPDSIMPDPRNPYDDDVDFSTLALQDPDFKKL